MVNLVKTHKGSVYGQENGVLVPVITEGLVGYWPMTQGSGTTLYDESKIGNTGTINGAVWVETANGKALDFDGIDDKVVVSDFSQLGSFSVSIWIKSSALDQANQTGILSTANAGPDSTFQLDFNNGAYNIHGSTADGSTYDIAISDDSTTWDYLNVTWDNSDAELKGYLNGSLVLSDTSTLSTDDIGVFNLLKAGVNRGDNLFYNGIIDEVRVYDRALSAQEITNIYEKTRGLHGV